MNIEELREKALAALAGASSEDAIEAVRVDMLGKKGEVSLALRELGSMSDEERKVVGPKLNALRGELADAIGAKKEGLADAALNERLVAEWLDLSQPARPHRLGTVHPISQVTEEIITIFADLGYAVAEGPQIESDWYNLFCHLRNRMNCSQLMRARWLR